MASGTEEIREIELLRRQVQTFYRVNRFVGGVYDLEQLLNLIMHEAEAAVDAEASCIANYEESDHLLHIEFASGGSDEGVKNLALQMGQGILGVCAATRKAMRVPDVSQDAQFDPSIDRQTGFTTKSILAVPIMRRDRLLGVLEVINKRGPHPFTDEDSRLLEVVATQAAVAIENARLFEQIVQSEQLLVIGRMAAFIIHDLKQPISVIRGFAEMLGKPEIDPEHRQTFSNLIIADVDRFQNMIEELLDYSRGTIQVQRQEIQLGDWLDEFVSSLRGKLDSLGIEVVTHFNYRGPVWIDQERMRRALNNIAVNASEAMPGGGTLTVATRSANSHWELELRDTGTGIPPHLRQRMFEPFVTFGKERGTGLGLAMVRDIVESHGGTIHASSKFPGEEFGQAKGSVFLIRMPAHDASRTALES